MEQAAKPTRQNHIIAVDFQDEATSLVKVSYITH